LAEFSTENVHIAIIIQAREYVGNQEKLLERNRSEKSTKKDQVNQIARQLGQKHDAYQP
jgi:hypothetical protein